MHDIASQRVQQGMHKKYHENTATTNRYNLWSRVKGTNYKHQAAQYLVAQEIFRHCAMHINDDHGHKLSMEDLLNGPDGTSIWDKALSNEWGRLAQGNIYGIKHTDTIEFIHQSEVPKDKKVTYAGCVCGH